MSAAPNPYIYVLDSLSRADALERLAAMPSQLRSIVLPSHPARLSRAPADGEWTAFQTFCHMRDAAFIYALRFRWMVFDDDPLLTNYDENNWVAAAKDAVTDVPDILDQIAASRDDLMRVLSRLTDIEWRRTGRHEVAGTVVLEDYVRHQVAHEAMHLDQILVALG